MTYYKRDQCFQRPPTLCAHVQQWLNFNKLLFSWHYYYPSDFPPLSQGAHLTVYPVLTGYLELFQKLRPRIRNSERISLYVDFLLLVHVPPITREFLKNRLHSQIKPWSLETVQSFGAVTPQAWGESHPHRCTFTVQIWEPLVRVAGPLAEGSGWSDHQAERDRETKRLIWFSRSHTSSAGLPSGGAQEEVRGRWNPRVWSLQVSLAGREDGQGWRVSMRGAGGRGREAFGTEAVLTHSLGSVQLARREGRRRKGGHLVSW